MAKIQREGGLSPPKLFIQSWSHCNALWEGDLTNVQSNGWLHDGKFPLGSSSWDDGAKLWPFPPEGWPASRVLSEVLKPSQPLETFWVFPDEDIFAMEIFI